MKKLQFRRVFSLILVLCLVLPLLPLDVLADALDPYSPANFKGLVVKAESNVTMVFYKNHTRDAEDKIQPDHTVTEGSYTYYYFAGISGSYCYDAKRTGDYTIYQKLYITSAEAKT